MNIDDYEYFGFKLYSKTIIRKYNGDQEINKYHVIVQYKNGVPFKCWSEEILLYKDEESNRWISSNIDILNPNDEFIRNMTEEEVFAIFL